MIRETVDRISKLKLRRRRPRRRDLIEPAAVIDLDEFEAARRNPRLRQLLEDAVDEGERMRLEELRRRPDVLCHQGAGTRRPHGRGIVLAEEPGEPLLEDWMQTWLAKRAPHRPVSGGEFRVRLRIIVEHIDESAQVQ